MIHVDCIEMQTDYTVKRNTLMPYNSVLDVSVHKKYHRTPFVLTFKNVISIVICRFFTIYLCFKHVIRTNKMHTFFNISLTVRLVTVLC